MMNNIQGPLPPEKKEEPKQAWLMTYADMMTLLFAFFVMLYSLSSPDPVKISQIQDAMQKEAGLKGTIQSQHEIKQEFEKIVEEDYVFLGFRPGSTQVILGMGTAIDDVFDTDHRGKPLSEIPMMREIKNYDQVDLVLDLASSATPGAWITYTNTKYKQQVAAGVTGVMVSELYPYIQTGQLVGLMPGLLGAAEYENLIQTPASGTAGMSVQSFVHLLVFGLVVMGNVAFFFQRRTVR